MGEYGARRGFRWVGFFGRGAIVGVAIVGFVRVVGCGLEKVPNRGFFTYR